MRDYAAGVAEARPKALDVHYHPWISGPCSPGSLALVGLTKGSRNIAGTALIVAIIGAAVSAYEWQHLSPQGLKTRTSLP